MLMSIFDEFRTQERLEIAPCEGYSSRGLNLLDPVFGPHLTALSTPAGYVPVRP